MVIGPNPVHYANQPQLFSTHQQVFRLLAGRVQGAQANPAVLTQVSDAFERARQDDAQNTTGTPAEALTRLATGFYQRLVQLGLLPSRDTADVNHSMVGHSTAVVTAMETLDRHAMQYLSTAHDANRTGSRVLPAQVPPGFIVVGRSEHASQQRSGDRLGRFHMSAQVQGDHIAVRDGFYELPSDLTQPAASQRFNWAGSMNGSNYLDEDGRRTPIPSDQPIVLPNQSTLFSLGGTIMHYENGRIQPATPTVMDAVHTRRLDRALVELRQGQRQDILLGREGNLILNEATVSRRHARITWDGQNYMIQDLGSLRGTTITVHDQVAPIDVPEISPVRIPTVPGTRLELGDTTLGFNPPTEPPSGTTMAPLPEGGTL